MQSTLMEFEKNFEELRKQFGNQMLEADARGRQQMCFFEARIETLKSNFNIAGA